MEKDKESKSMRRNDTQGWEPNAALSLLLECFIHKYTQYRTSWKLLSLKHLYFQPKLGNEVIFHKVVKYQHPLLHNYIALCTCSLVLWALWMSSVFKLSLTSQGFSSRSRAWCFRPGVPNLFWPEVYFSVANPSGVYQSNTNISNHKHRRQPAVTSQQHNTTLFTTLLYVHISIK